MEMLREIDSSSKLVGKTLISQLYPLLERIKSRAQRGPSKTDDGSHEKLTAQEREQLLAIYSALSNQMDSLWNSFVPEAALAMVIPSKLPEPAPPAPVPAMLSTFIGAQDKDCLYIPQAHLINALSVEEENAIEAALAANTVAVERAIDQLSENIDKFRAKFRQRREQVAMGADGSQGTTKKRKLGD